MRTEPDVTRIVRSWLEEGADRLPDRVLDAVLDQVPTTPQRRPISLARRLPIMPNLFRAAVLAAAVVVAAVAGINLLPGSGVGTAPTPLPTSSPIVIGDADIQRILPAGRYRIADKFGLPFSITLPPGWVVKNISPGDVEFSRSAPPNGAPWVTVHLVEKVFPDPCHTESGPVAPPPTVAGVVDALTHMVGFPAGPVSDVVIGGYQGKSFELTNSIDTDTANCTGGPMLPLFTFRGDTAGAQTNSGSREQISVLDVNGTLFLVDGESFTTTPEIYRQEIDEIIPTISFD